MKNFRQKISFLFIFQMVVILFSYFFISQSIGKSKPENAGSEGGNKISTEEGYFLIWQGSAVELSGLPNLPRVRVNFNEVLPKKEVPSLGAPVEEQDLGGNLKKKAPLAYKNPRFRNIQMAQGGDPSLVKGMSPKKVTEVPKDSGKEITLEYGDGSKEIILESPLGREENFYDRKGAWVWKKTEKESQGIKIKKTQWQDGTVISEYANASGVVSFLRDQERNILTVSFLNNNKNLLKELVCENNVCAEN